MMHALSAAFESFGFVPIDTPVLEYAEILLGKAGGETEKQVYRFADAGGRDVAMRFDLTVPFARFMAEHVGELYLPFKRYHMAKVWRGENTQRGRYREFMQCDFDQVGVDSAAADFEILAVICTATEALGVKDSSVHLNHRGVFNRFLTRLGIADKSVEVLRVVDKLHKIGADATKSQLAALAGSSAADEVLAYIEGISNFDACLNHITMLSGGANPDSDRLRALGDMADACGLSSRVKLVPSITRGLDYYTGVVYETFLDAMPDIGSVCSGGRYNDLASLYTKQKLPGVGASVGLDRLFAALEALGRAEGREGCLDVLVAHVDDGLEAEYQAAAAAIRSSGFSCEAFPERRKLGQQFAHAERKGARWAVMRGGNEKARSVWILRDLSNRTDTEFTDIASMARSLTR